MTFLNTVLLAGTAAGGIPVAIHLLQRRRRKVVHWGAMQLLSPKTNQRNRTLQLDHLLLLLLRAAIPVVLALCMAKPLIPGLPADTDPSPTSLVILLDDSASMGDGAPSSALGQVKSAAASLLKALPRGSEVSVIPLTDPDAPLVELTTDIPGASRKTLMRPSQVAGARISDSLDAAATLLNRSHNARRRLAILSDFQASNWPVSEGESRLQILHRIQTQKSPPGISIFQTQAAQAQNTAIESLEFSRVPTGPNQRLRFVATVHNHGTTPRNGIQVRWKVDGQTLSSTQIDLPQKQRTQVVLEKAFSETGDHTVQVSSDSDSFPFDDAFTAVVTVHNPIPVLLVNGRPSREPLQGETDFLEIALQSKTSHQQDGSSFFQTSVIDPSALTSKTLEQTRTVILADVRTLGAQQVRDLENFVKGGGGVIFFPGRQTDSVWANKALHNNGEGLLPSPISAFSSEGTGRNQPVLSVAKPYPRHPILEPFQPSQSAFDDLRIKAWFSLHHESPRSGSEGQRHLGEILSLDNGDALFMEGKFGAGTVIQSAVPCNAEWTNLPTRPAFVPLVQRMASYCAIGSDPVTNIVSGARLPVNLPPRFAGQTATIINPLGKTTQVPLYLKDERAIGQFASTHAPGMYRASFPSGDTRTYAVNPPKEESDLEPLNTEAMDALAKACATSVSRSPTELVFSIRDAAEGREIWRPLVLATLLLLFAELCLSHRFSRTRKAAR